MFCFVSWCIYLQINVNCLQCNCIENSLGTEIKVLVQERNLNTLQICVQIVVEFWMTIINYSF